MVCISNIVAALATASIIGSAVAHPGETLNRTQIGRDIMKRDALALEACSNTLKARQLDERAIARRSAKATNSEQLVELAPALRSWAAAT
jgi:predicted DNA-binding ArsR family transcriptional regulator